MIISEHVSLSLSFSNKPVSMGEKEVERIMKIGLGVLNSGGDVMG
jgi:hypothetical protein